MGIDEETAALTAAHQQPYGAAPVPDATSDEDDDDDDDKNPRHQAFREARHSYVSVSQPLSFGDAPDNNHGLFYSLRRYNSTVRDAVLSNTFVFSGMLASVREAQGTATVPNEVLNLIKNVVGAGALALPSGVAAMGNASGVLVPAAIGLLGMGTIFGYYFHLIGRVCRMTGTVSYAEAWKKSEYGGAGWVALAVALKAGSGNLECSMILADSGRDLFATAGVAVTRTTALWSITGLALLPLCLLKNLAVLVPFSMAGLCAMLFTAGAVMVRYLDGSYAPDGQFLDDIPHKMQPSFGTVGAVGAFHVQVLLFLCMLSEAYIAHYNSPRFWVELKDRTVPRFGKVVSYSFGISAIYYVFVTSFGFLTFGASCSGYILDNYATTDVLASISRSCVSFSLIVTYPIIFMGFRDGILDVLAVPRELQTAMNLNVLTVFLLFVITVLATVINDLGAVVAVGGGTLGTIVVFIVPTLMFCRAIERLGGQASLAQKREVHLAKGLMGLGIFIGVVGVFLALRK